MSYAHDPVHWRNRERSMRAMAKQTNNAEAKAMIIKLADDYEARAYKAELRVLEETNNSENKLTMPADDYVARVSRIEVPRPDFAASAPVATLKKHASSSVKN
jgi:hypothetical protein